MQIPPAVVVVMQLRVLHIVEGASIWNQPDLCLRVAHKQGQGLPVLALQCVRGVALVGKRRQPYLASKA